MKTLLCGAADIRRIIPQFNQVMADLRYQPLDYIDGTLGGTNANNWAENSQEAVESADLIIFVLIEKAGDITWETEYTTAYQIGKPYILLCEKQLAEHYYNIISETGMTVDSRHRFYKAKNILDLLTSHRRTITTFDLEKADFKDSLLKQINFELVRGMKRLQIHNKNKTILSLIKSKNYKSIISKDVTIQQVDFFKNTLFDPFENKEIRKRMLYFFTINKGLTDQEIGGLFEDSEQGISRMAVDNAAKLLNQNNDVDLIIKDLTRFVESTTDTGTIRRAISSIFEIDFKLGLENIFKLFPAHDIGTPRRVLEWLTQNFNGFGNYIKEDNILFEINRLKVLCLAYSKPESIEKLADKLDELIWRQNTLDGKSS